MPDVPERPEMAVPQPAGPPDDGGRSSPANPTRTRFPWRGLLLALLLAPVDVYWTTDQAVDIILSLMVPPVVLTLLAVIFNSAIRIVRRQWCLATADLVTIYAMLSVITAMSAEWAISTTPMIYAYALYADSSNKYADRILAKMPSLFFLKDATKFQDFKVGGRSFDYFLAHLHLWTVPVLAWTLLTSLLAFAMLCINNLMREEWTQREKLSFPIIQLPMAMTDDGGASPVWKSSWLWGGFAIFFSIDILNGFHFLFPTIPLINYRFIGDVSSWATGSPWNAIGWTPIGIFPFVTAIGLFLPTDLLFSVIFFFRKAQQVVAASLGFPQGVFGGGGLVPSPPYFSEQTWGAFIGLFVMAIWVARSYLKELWLRIRTNDSPGQRWALIGLGASLIGLMALAAQAGLSPGFVLFYVGLFLVFSIALTRMRAELGPPTHEMAFMGPNQFIVDMLGTRGMSPTAVTGMSTLFYFTNRLHRSDPMPSELEAMKMGERARMNPAHIFAAVALAIVIGTLLGHLTRIYQGYVWGAGGVGEAGGAAGIAQDLLDRPRQPNGVANLFMLGGFLMVVGLNFLRYRLASFPLNPVGYALAMNFGVDYYWFGLLLALLTKLAVQRYVGLKGYTKLHAFALGVILGEFSAEGIWSTVSMVFHGLATYSISINGRLGWNQ